MTQADDNTDATVTPFPKRAKIVVDQATITFAELAELEESLGTTLSALFEKSQARGMAAIAWLTVKRTNPEFTYAEAMQLGPNDLDVVGEGKAPGVSDGAPQPKSPEPGA